MSIESAMLSNHLIYHWPLVLLPSVLPSIRVFSNESALCIRWPKYWSFSFSISPFSEYSGLISFRIDWFDLLAVQWTLKSLLQHHNSKISILRGSAFFLVQLSYQYISLEKPLLQLCVPLSAKWYLCFLIHCVYLSIAFLQRSKYLLNSLMQSSSAGILQLKKRKSVTISTFPPSICHKVMGPDTRILVFWMLSFKPAFLLFCFILIKRLFSFSSLFAIRVVSSAYLRLLIFLPIILIPACYSSSPAFCMMYSTYKLNKQGDNIQPWHTPFPVLN